MFRRWIRETFAEEAKITSWGLKVKADLKTFQDHFENIEKIFQPILELDPSVPDDIAKYLRKVRKANALWAVYHQDSLDHGYWKQMIQHMRLDEREGSREQQKFEEAQENLKISKERLMNLFNYLDSNRDRVHNSALRAVSDVLSRIQPKWRNEQPPPIAFGHDVDDDDDVQPLDPNKDNKDPFADFEKSKVVQGDTELQEVKNEATKGTFYPIDKDTFMKLAQAVLRENTDFQNLTDPEVLFAKFQEENVRPEQCRDWIVEEYEKELEERQTKVDATLIRGKPPSDT